MRWPLGVGVVGLGFGRAHLAGYPNLGDRFEVVAVCDHTPAHVDQARSWFRSSTA